MKRRLYWFILVLLIASVTNKVFSEPILTQPNYQLDMRRELSIPGGAYSLSFMPNSAAILIGNSTTVCWDFVDSQVLFTFPISGSVSISPHTAKFLTTDGSQVFEWKYPQAELLHTCSVNNDNSHIFSVNYSPDGSKIILAGRFGGLNRAAVILASNSCEEVASFYSSSGSTFIAIYSPDGSYIYTGGSSGRMHVWDATTFSMIHEIPCEFTPLSAIFVMEKNLLIVGNSFHPPSIDNPAYGGQALVYDINIGNLVHRIIGHSGDVTALALSPDGQYLLTASRDTTAKLWNLENYEPVLTLTGSEDYLLSADFSRDGKWIALGDYRGVITIWDVSDIAASRVEQWKVYGR